MRGIQKEDCVPLRVGRKNSRASNGAHLDNRIQLTNETIRIDAHGAEPALDLPVRACVVMKRLGGVQDDRVHLHGAWRMLRGSCACVRTRAPKHGSRPILWAGRWIA